MTRTFRVPAGVNMLIAGALAVALLLVTPHTFAYEPPASDYLRATDPALGISIDFGRWNSQVNLIYDPDNAPGMFADSDRVLAMIEQAAAEWELVSGIRFNVTGADSNAAEDDDAGPLGKDGLVRVFWGSAGGASGQAGPDGDFYDEDLGYYPYIDGSVELNEDPGQWESEVELVRTLVHELGHLMGLGHSDNPASLMYANPYNHLRHPRPDDILAARALYGNGTLAIADVTEPVSEWTYSPPATASAAATENLFKANAILDAGSFIGLDAEQPLSAVDAQTPDGQFVWFFFASGPDNSGDIAIDATFVIVDPFGYVYDARDYQIECEMNFSCAAGATVAESQVIKTIPGEWTLYIIDDDTNTTLHEFTFDVNTSTTFNSAPVAEVMVTGVSSTVVNIRLALTDAEDDAIEVVWHPQGNLGTATGIVDAGFSNGTVSRNISFLSASIHTLFIELRDDAPRYDGSLQGSSSAGEGFRNLIAITVNLPLAGDNDVEVRRSYLTQSGSAPSLDTGGGSGQLSGIVLVNAIAEATTLESITTSDRSTTTAKFGAGATADSGLTTATTFNAGDDIVIAGSVSPQLGDIGHAGEVFIVLYTDTSLSYLDVDGNFVSWGGSLKNLQPAFERTDLLLTENFEVFSGAVQSGLYRVFMGYRVTEGEGGPIHFNAKAFRVTVN